MKKILSFAVVLSALASQAASFAWGTGTIAVSFGGTTIADGSATMYLVLLDSADTTKMYTIDYTAPGTITTVASVQGSATSTAKRTAGRVSDTYKSDSIAGNQIYGAFLKWTDSDNKVWYNFSADTYTVSTAVDDDPTTTLQTAEFGFNLSTQTTITKSGETPSGWTTIAVPEPSTAALALAGLALLLKRRKA